MNKQASILLGLVMTSLFACNTDNNDANNVITIPTINPAITSVEALL